METVEEKVRERRRKVAQIRRRRRLRLLLILLVLALIVWGGIRIYNSDLFNIKRINVTGNSHLSDEHIVKRARVPRKTSLLKIPLKQIRNRLLQEPWVKDVRILRHLPNTLEIRIRERKPMAIIPIDESFILIDGEGFVLECRGDLKGLDMPAIRDLKIGSFQIGKRLRSKSLSNALACLRELDPDLRDSLNMVSASSADKLSLYTKDDVEILYGKAENNSKKNFIIKKILSEPGGKIIFIDVRVVSNPVVKRLEGVPKSE
ncbi:MAG: FtsQ-type POTRA domain-containing protein [Actinomycetota bacterium]